ncbi:hypothetical protein B0J13DRAFT_134145 [Dactylonectria estremocensis]|uniref:Uncharacterized protein n=1 Tax=Dactylonectria estremocensis TaxID=1079267 RepID=A0A9P9E4T8_9HYPO|nr:hypothetical protein B0J13DRAFT_134145 [Dactylonectria estremocensis]
MAGRANAVHDSALNAHHVLTFRTGCSNISFAKTAQEITAKQSKHLWGDFSTLRLCHSVHLPTTLITSFHLFDSHLKPSKDPSCQTYRDSHLSNLHTRTTGKFTYPQKHAETMSSLSNQAPPGHINVSPLIYRPKTTMQRLADLYWLLASFIVTVYRLFTSTKTTLLDIAPQIHRNPYLLLAPANAFLAHFKRLSALEVMKVTTIACLMHRLPIRIAIILWDMLCAASSVLLRFTKWGTNQGIESFPWLLRNWARVVSDIVDILIFMLIALVLIALILALVVLPLLSKKNGDEESWETPDTTLTSEDPNLQGPIVPEFFEQTPATKQATHEAREEQRQGDERQYRKEQRIQEEQQETRRSTSGERDQNGFLKIESTVPNPEVRRLQEEFATERFLNQKLQAEVARLKVQVAKQSQDNQTDGEHPNVKRSGGRTHWTFGQVLARQREDSKQKEYYMEACRIQCDEIQELNKQLKDTQMKATRDLEFVRRKLIAADERAGEHMRLKKDFEEVQRKLEVSEDRRRQASERQRAAEKAARRR